MSTMKMNLPPFIEIYRALIATPSISATEEALDQSNETLITITWSEIRMFWSFIATFHSIASPCR
jgi:hypothetical protein